MSMVFKFRMLSDLSDNFVRDYEVMYDTNLLDFNDFICEDLGYDIEGMASFFFSDGQWRKLQEYTLMDMDTEAEQVRDARKGAQGGRSRDLQYGKR